MRGNGVTPLSATFYDIRMQLRLSLFNPMSVGGQKGRGMTTKWEKGEEGGANSNPRGSAYKIEEVLT